MSGPRPRRRPPLRLRLLLLGFAFLLAIGGVEVGLRLAPRLLPAWYRERFPPHGIEFFHPGLLDRTPLQALPLPYGVEPYDGPAPHDLIDLGFAPLTAASGDGTTTPRFMLPADAEGLPNATPVPEADIALVGDSFTLFAAQQQPAGLQMALERDLQARIVNVGVSGIGPDQELWLLQNRALPCRPRLVLWLFFGGNDLIDAFWLQFHLAQGMRTFGDLMANKRVPTLRVPSLLWQLCTNDKERPKDGPFPGFVVANNPQQRLWFFPDSLRVMTLAPHELTANPGWLGATTAMRAARAATEAAGARFLLVYLPSKDHIYLPRVQPDPEQLQRTVAASNLQAIAVPADGESLRAALLQNRLALEDAVMAFAAAEGMAAWSARPTLEAAADRGEITFYAADTHWNTTGQLAVAAALIDVLRARGLLTR